MKKLMLKEVTKKYGNVVAVNRVNQEIDDKDTSLQYRKWRHNFLIVLFPGSNAASPQTDQ
ncbi:MAG: hypothetical protein JSW00_09045 [Thermoplasmata archaeon]|nr:MAG: hypothetical protein JSW00_09045 [Thermoplasmata archaeon]UCG64754.1 MAG: hypothetical protein JSW12_19410 [Deltaproteobacteria bacterium]